MKYFSAVPSGSRRPSAGAGRPLRPKCSRRKSSRAAPVEISKPGDPGRRFSASGFGDGFSVPVGPPFRCGDQVGPLGEVRCGRQPREPLVGLLELRSENYRGLLLELAFKRLHSQLVRSGKSSYRPRYLRTAKNFSGLSRPYWSCLSRRRTPVSRKETTPSARRRRKSIWSLELSSSEAEICLPWEVVPPGADGPGSPPGNPHPGWPGGRSRAP